MKSAADSLSFDLEDSVDERRKSEARAEVARFLRGLPDRPGKTIIVRVNACTTPHFHRDIEALAGAPVDIVNVPKAESAAAIRDVRRRHRAGAGTRRCRAGRLAGEHRITEGVAPGRRDRDGQPEGRRAADRVGRSPGTAERRSRATGRRLNRSCWRFAWRPARPVSGRTTGPTRTSPILTGIAGRLRPRAGWGSSARARYIQARCRSPTRCSSQRPTRSRTRSKS